MQLRQIAIILGLILIAAIGYFSFFPDAAEDSLESTSPAAADAAVEVGLESASPAAAAVQVASAILDPENILVLELAGEANGTVEILLRPDLAPLHVAQISALVREGVYDGIAFHRVIEGFMAQTGDVQFGGYEDYDPRRAGTGGSDLPDIPAEFSNLSYAPGVVGMARSNQPNSANSQFFIMFAEYPSLDGQYTVIGRVIEGMDVVNAIKRPVSGQVVLENPDYIAKAYIKADGAPE